MRLLRDEHVISAVSAFDISNKHRLGSLPLVTSDRALATLGGIRILWE